MAKYKVVAFVQIETDDPRLDPERIDVSTAAATATLRRAVIAALPKKVSRLIAVTAVETAELMCMAHDAGAAAAGLGGVKRPPADYIPPTRD
jgi:phospholipase C